MDRHVDMSKTQVAIKDIFPPEQFEYEQLEELKDKEDEDGDQEHFDQEVSNSGILRIIHNS